MTSSLTAPHDDKAFRMLCIIDEFSRESLAIRVARKLKATDVIEALCELFVSRGIPAHTRSDNGPEFVAEALRDWIASVGARTAYTMSRRKEPAIPAELLDQLLAGSDAATALDRGGLLDSLKKALAERALNAEMDHHLGEEAQAGNSRNGYGRKTVVTDTGKIDIDVPRDRQGSFDPQLIAKYQRRFPGFDDKIISMYARGMSTREITGICGSFMASTSRRI
jgi:hypothetical protein